MAFQGRRHYYWIGNERQLLNSCEEQLMKRMIRYLCALVFTVVATTSAAHSYCANLNTLEVKGVACCCSVHTDCSVLQSTCCSASQGEQATAQIDDASTQPPVVTATSITKEDLLPVSVLSDSKSTDLSYVFASNKLYLQKRSLLI